MERKISKCLFMILMCFICLSFMKMNVQAEETKLLEECSIIASDRYTGNMGDSFVAAGVANSDLNGNAITKGVSIFLARWNFTQEKSWATATFDIGGKWAVLETQLILVQYTNTTNFDTTVYFYGDGRLLASYNFLPNTEPIDIKLAVIGVNNLEIKASDNIAVAGGTAWALKDAILSDTEKSVTGVKEFIDFTDKLPKLSEDSAKQFLVFVYNCADYEKVDLSNDMAYNLLIGNYRIFNSVEQIKIEISNLSLWVRASMNKQAGDAEYRVNYLTDNLLTFWESQYSGMSGLDASIINEVTKKFKSYVQNGIEGFLASGLAKASDIIITEDKFQWSNLMVSSYKDFTGLPNKIQDCIDKMVASVETIMLPFESEVKGRTMYFNNYLSNRKDYESADDYIFQTIMDYNLLAISDNTYMSNALWFIGKDSWTKHKDTINEWAENLYQLEQYVNYDTHVYESQHIEPTIYEEGYDLYICKYCGKEYKDNYLSRLSKENNNISYNIKQVLNSAGTKGLIILENNTDETDIIKIECPVCIKVVNNEIIYSSAVTYDNKVYSFEVTQDKLSQYVSDDYFNNVNSLPNTDAIDNRNIYIIIFSISTILFIGFWRLKKRMLL